MTDLALSLIIDDQEVDFEVATAAVTDIVSAPQFTAVVAETPGVDVEVASPPTVDVSTLTQPFTVITVEGPPGQTGPPGDGTQIVGETPAGVINGANTIFTTAHPYQTGTTVLYRNGLRQILGLHYTESATSTITVDDPPLIGDQIILDYLLEGM
jgi:hypothetical protein